MLLRYVNLSLCLKFIIFAILIVVSYFFASSSLSEYLKGHTAFHFSTRPFTVEDMQITSICAMADETIDFKKNLVIEVRIRVHRICGYP